MARRATIALYCFAASVSALPQSGIPQNELKDPAFSSIPFEQWFKESSPAHFRWTIDVADPVLSSHQRLVSRVRIKVDGNELAQRRGKGQFVLLVQITDESGHVFQVHDDIDLEKVQASAKANDFEYLQPFFALPGQYTLSLATYNTATRDHSTARRKLNVPRLKNDPLPDAWKNLPAIEFLRSPGAPESWYLPLIEGRLNLPAATAHKTKIEVIVNLTPSERLSGSAGLHNRAMAVLMPALKNILQTTWSDGSVAVTFLDLSQRRVVFHEEDVKALDWEQAIASLAETRPGVIDVKALENRRYSADFFVSEVRKRFVAADPARRVVIVLTSPVLFDSGVDFHAAEAPEGADSKLFYIRYQPLPPERPPVLPGIPTRPFARRPSMDGLPNPPSYEPDQLEPLLKALNPRLFDIASPEQFRKALAAMLAEAGQP